jgi:oligopeptide/dipeptide ABC transporter ATP-binding protein
MNDHSTLLSVDSLRVALPAGRRATREIVAGVTLALAAGESLGVVGESGSGKSVTAKAVLRALGPAARVSGQVDFAGRDVYRMTRPELQAWHARQVALIYQDPRAHINPLHTVGDFLTEGLRRQGTPAREARDRAAGLLTRVGIADAERRMRQHPHQMSGGLLQRIMIAAALLTGPRLLIADEPTTALDVTTQEEVVAILAELRAERGLGLIFITHDLDLSAAVTDRIAVMYAGAIVETGASADVYARPRHPYTAGLLAARPSIDRRAKLTPIPGRPASAFEVGPGCVFSARCPFALPLCERDRPLPQAVDGRLVACHRAGELTLAPGQASIQPEVTDHEPADR